ncbi:MAG: cupredoxin domain-containing protein [Solirubrobacterales bacterium]
MRTHRRPVALIVCALVAILVVAAGCGGDEEEPAATATGSEAPGDAETDATTADAVEIADFEFDPPTITVETGTALSWSNGDSAAHTASAEDGSFDTGALNKGDEGKASFDKPGTYAYICEFHPFMKGTVEVE